ncbi:MAG: YiiD C-terminal domain-containing protein, partial [Moraxellaceae bacterium]|nr:YiiD C-terminal domain-containing protein [Moraxellaceae bacterium]
MTDLVQAKAFVLQMREQMPLLNFMQIDAKHWDGQVLTLSAPLEPNRNDKNTAFAGSIASLSTVTGWALLMLWCE